MNWSLACLTQVCTKMKKKWELYKEMIVFGLKLTPPKTWQNGGARFCFKIGNSKIYIARYIFELVLGVVG